MKRKSLNFSPIREVVIREIIDSKRILCGDEIHKRVNKRSQKKVSFNTVYRILRLLEECELVVTIQSDFKRTHYALITSTSNIYLLDKNSNYLVALENSSLSHDLLKEHNLEDTKSFIVIHKNNT
jgi:Fe2+ or Zn2+ uptake regulation protein